MPIYNSNGNQFVKKISSNGGERYRVYVVHSNGTNDLVYSKITIRFHTDSTFYEDHYWYGQEVSFSTPFASGKSFKGWFDSYGNKISGTNDIIPDWWKETTETTVYHLYAKWGVTISFGKNSNVANLTHWSTDEELMIQSLPASIQCDSTDSFAAVLSGIACTCNSRVNNGFTLWFGTAYDNDSDSFQVKQNITITLSFEGWGTEPDGNNPINESAAIETNTTLYPRFRDLDINNGYFEQGGEGSYSGNIYLNGNTAKYWTN